MIKVLVRVFTLTGVWSRSCKVHLLRFLGWILRLVQNHPGTSILIFLGLAGAVFTGLTYYETVLQSKRAESRIEAEQRIVVDLASKIDLSSVYFVGFDNLFLPPSRHSLLNQGVPESLAQSDLAFWGLMPHLIVKVHNQSLHPVSIDHATTRMRCGAYEVSNDMQAEYFRDGSEQARHFPLFSERNQEELLILRFNWPITGDLTERLEPLTRDSLYSAHYLVDAFYSGTGRGIIGAPGIYPHKLLGILLENLQKQMGSAPDTASGVIVTIFLATGERFSSKAALSQ